MKANPRNDTIKFLALGRKFSSAVVILVFHLQSSAQTSPAPAEPEEAIELSPFEVEATQGNSYLATNSAVGTRIAVPLESLPLTASVVTSDFIHDRGWTSLNDAVRQVPGIRRNANNSDQFTIRGFQARAARRNYFSDAADLSEGRGRNEMAEIERIEVVKGPTSVLFGFGNPGGVINILTKKPLAKQQAVLTLEGGDFDLFRTTIDATGPLAKVGEGQLLYRVIGAYQDAGGFRDFEGNKQEFLNTQLQYNYKRTMVRAEVRIQDLDEREAFILMPFEPNTGTLALPERTYNTGGPETWAKQRQITTYLEATHVFNQHLSLRLAAARDEHYYDALRRVGAQIPPTQVPLSNATTVVVTGNINNDKRAIDSWQADLTGSFDLPFGNLKTVIGASNAEADARISSLVNNNLPQRNFPVFNIATRNYSVGPLSSYVVSPTGTSTEARTDKVYYALAILTALDERLTLMAGVGRGESETFLHQYLTTTPPSRGEFEVTKPQFGASFRIVPDIYLFANTSESATANLRFPDSPEEGKSRDFGIKVAKDRFSGSITYFDTTRENIQVQLFDGLTGLFTFELSGEESSKGVEAEFQFFPTDQFQLLGSYTFLDTEVISDLQRPARVGTELPDAPRDSYRMWAKYSFNKGPLDRFWVGLGYTYTSDMTGNRNPAIFRIRTASWSRWDASLGYSMEIGRAHVDWLLTMDNLTDEDYIDYMLIRGRPFNAKLTARIRF